MTFVCPSSSLAVSNQTVCIEEACFVCKDYSGMVVVSQLAVVLRHCTLTIARTGPLALGWLFVHTGYTCMEPHRKGDCRFLHGIPVLVIDTYSVVQAEKPC